MRFHVYMLICIFSFLTGLECSAYDVLDLNTMSLTTKNVSLLPDICTVENGDTTTITVCYRYVAIQSLGQGKSLISIPSYYVNSTVGEPEHPVKYLNYSIPENQNIDFRILQHEYVEYTISLPLAERPSAMNTTNENKSLDSGLTLHRQGYFPQEVATPQEMQFYRGHAFMPIRLTPVQTNETNTSARITTKLTYQLINNKVEPLLKSSGSLAERTIMDITPNDYFYNDFISNTTKISNSAQKELGEVGTLLPNPTSTRVTKFDKFSGSLYR